MAGSLAHSGRQLLSAALHGPSATSAERAAPPPVPPARGGHAVSAVPGAAARRKRVAAVPQFAPARTEAVPRMPTRKHTNVPGF